VQLLPERPAREAPPTVPAADPRLGEGRVVDQPDLAEPVQHCSGRLVGNSTFLQGCRQLGPRPRLPGEQPQADGAGGLLGIGRGLGRSVGGPGLG
jgi:hypothetical protein